ncbi:hypothetical protein TSUD_78860 [Trifolium subterraneum]|uniref:Uncharacterized protein n=1 Tax=Trifolium subterraneum TaxID=3900 RepID=A0A2Z6M4H6_TRISU|nr:hypothetical protein TSUD_78860 [Trifolium subterraneum]
MEAPPSHSLVQIPLLQSLVTVPASLPLLSSACFSPLGPPYHRVLARCRGVCLIWTARALLISVIWGLGGRERFWWFVWRLVSSWYVWIWLEFGWQSFSCFGSGLVFSIPSGGGEVMRSVVVSC